jgi:hypothetical protein
MKSFALATALVALSAVGSFAQQAPVALPSSITSEILTVLPGADLSSLSNSQYAQIVSFFADTENTRTSFGTAQGVKAILSNAQ